MSALLSQEALDFIEQAKVTEFFGDEMKHCFLSLRAFWLAGEDLTLAEGV